MTWWPDDLDSLALEKVKKHLTKIESVPTGWAVKIQKANNEIVDIVISNRSEEEPITEDEFKLILDACNSAGEPFSSLEIHRLSRVL
jgi:hypothetical protein